MIGDGLTVSPLAPVIMSAAILVNCDMVAAAGGSMGWPGSACHKGDTQRKVWIARTSALTSRYVLTIVLMWGKKRTKKLHSVTPTLASFVRRPVQQACLFFSFCFVTEGTVKPKSNGVYCRRRGLDVTFYFQESTPHQQKILQESYIRCMKYSTLDLK